jgi:hypothetical protein
MKVVNNPMSSLHQTMAQKQTREYVDWTWPFSCVRSVKMVFSAQLAEVQMRPTLSLYLLYTLDSSYVARPPLHSKISEK